MSIRVTVTDTETGDTETAEIENDVIIVTAGTCHIAHFNDYLGTGTTIYTVKGRGGGRS